MYVDNQLITAHTPVLKDLLKLSDADKDKYNKLLNQRLTAHPLRIRSYQILEKLGITCYCNVYYKPIVHKEVQNILSSVNTLYNVFVFSIKVC